MKILILGSMSFTPEMILVGNELKKLKHQVTLPYFIEDYQKCNSREEMHSNAVKNKLSHDLFKRYYGLIKEHDAILIINKKKKEIENYIGANSLIEMVFAHLLNKKIFLLGKIPEIDYIGEIKATNPIILDGDLTKIPK